MTGAVWCGCLLTCFGGAARKTSSNRCSGVVVGRGVELVGVKLCLLWWRNGEGKVVA